MPAGRPTDYRPELGDEIVALMEQGYSLTAAAAKLGFHRQRAYEWESRHEEFADALKRARGLRLYKLETDLLSAVDSPNVTSRIFALKNADREEWSETARHELTGKDGGAIETRDIGAKELARRLAYVLAKGANDDDA